MRCRIHLICLRPFGAYAKGQRITDAAEVRALMRGRERYHFSLVRTILREIEPKAAQS
jgi:hypothetical protein